LNRRQFAALLSLVFAAFCVLGACKKPRTSVLAIAHVTVIDMTGAPPAPDQTVLVDKAKIIALGSSDSIAIPSGAKTITLQSGSEGLYYGFVAFAEAGFTAKRAADPR